MSRNTKPRKRYRPRQIAVNTLELALHRAAKPAKADREQVLDMLRQAVKAMREGVATEYQWSIVAGALDVARAIEEQGVVRGLSEHLDTAARALQAVYDRAMATGAWHCTALWYHELDAMQTFLDLYTFQVNQLSRAEFLAAIDQATHQVRRNGDTATIVRDVERMAA